MKADKIKLLKRKAKAAGCKTVEDYLLQCEMTQIVRRVNASFERAVILADPPDLWDVYLSDTENANKKGKKKNF